MFQISEGLFIMSYKGQIIKASKGKFVWCKGFIPQYSDSLQQAKSKITRWINS